MWLQDSDGEAGIALVGVHGEYPKYANDDKLFSDKDGAATVGWVYTYASPHWYNRQSSFSLSQNYFKKILKNRNISQYIFLVDLWPASRNVKALSLLYSVWWESLLTAIRNHYHAFYPICNVVLCFHNKAIQMGKNLFARTNTTFSSLITFLCF